MVGRFAVVTGGTKGIGLSFSRRLAALGFQVAALYRNDREAAESAVAEIGAGVVAIRCDVSDPAAVAELGETLRSRYAAPEVLVNNAGRNIDRPFLKLADDDWRQVIDTNLSGPFYMSREFAPAMLANGGGSIVNIGATTGIRPRLDGVNYCASKAGLLHLTKCLALELAPGIRVNCLIPGMIDTEEMRTRFRVAEPERLASLLAEIPQRRIGDPDDMADALAFLISDASRYITGQKFIVDGGQFMW
jgi:3-oxoacyl-[acyl-carrier protein] reductase